MRGTSGVSGRPGVATPVVGGGALDVVKVGTVGASGTLTVGTGVLTVGTGALTVGTGTPTGGRLGVGLAGAIA